MICIAGSGDAALDYALTMSKNNDVKILIRSKKVKALDSLVEAVNKKRNIEIISQTEIMKIAESKGKLNPECISTKGNFNLTCDILIFAIGREADLSYISDNSILKSEKFYMAGDIKNGNFRQAAIAIADGIRAAMDIHFKMGNNGTLSQDIRF